ncbi:PAS domain-containing protein [Heliobacterium undosum]|uniref:Cyclic-di-AMP phosphodiesterase n=1 Tax=Heliomicrobium undosum TaxID=121734 RepID=A0A845L3K7_9FIRM|nr:DHH family phosphoesterase [Heliomicrobium undosum]MZP29605.1 PAS domain-containing protein [Heliomicrobium undosum]
MLPGMKRRFSFWLLALPAVVGAGLLVAILAPVHRGVAGAMAALLVAVLFFAVESAYRWRQQAEERLSRLQEQFEASGANLLAHLPLGLVYIDSNGALLWHNPEFARMLGREGYRFKGKLRSHLPELHFKKNSGFSELVASRLVIRDRQIKVTLRIGPEEGRRLLALDDVTDYEQRAAREDGPVIGLCIIDNFDEAVAPLEDENKFALSAEIDKLLNEWAMGFEGFIRKVAEDRYVLLMTGSGLRLCQAHNFDVLDRIRSIRLENRIAVTLSIGLGVGEDSMADLGRLARTGVDLAMERGGDQVVVKSADRVYFYGGNTEAVEKRTRVRARVVAKSLRNLILAADNVVILGHEYADLDAAGAALGLSRAVVALGRPVSVVLDTRGGALDRLMPYVQANADLAKTLVSVEAAPDHVNARTLLVVVDTHKPSLLPDRTLLDRAGEIVIIDHHRRGEEFIDKNSLVYLEAYASSTCELVAEILQYLKEDLELGKTAASALLAGITVDTKHFVFMTGARTYEAASYLRRSGADPQLVQSLLRDPMETVVRRAAIIGGAEVHFGHIAIGVQEEAAPRATVISAQAADELLEVEGIQASFVLRPYPKGTAVSARSQGDINVHAILERLGGGGHLTIAGAQLAGLSLPEAKEKLLTAIGEYLEQQKEQKALAAAPV